jgi:imidazolonepropionase-like amidohydrolase
MPPRHRSLSCLRTQRRDCVNRRFSFRHCGAGLLVASLLTIESLTLNAEMQPAVETLPNAVALVGPTVINPARGEVIPDAVVLLEDDRIRAVGPSKDVPVPSNADRRDLHGKWVLPGYVDAHVHFFQSGGIYTRPDIVDLNKARPYRDEVAWIRAHLSDTFARYLACGITAVVDMGGPMWNFEVRQAARDGQVPAPQVAVAGPLISSVEDKPLDLGDPPIVKITDVAAARTEVRRQAEHQPDLIKIWYIVDAENKQTAESYRPVVRAVIEEAHALGLRVAVHATELETARAAVQEGADVLVHSVVDAPVDDAFVRLLREKKTVFIPTLFVFARYYAAFVASPDLIAPEFHKGNPDVMSSLFDARHLPLDLFPARLQQVLTGPDPAKAAEQRANLVLKDALPNLKKLRDGGVRIAAGTDAGNPGILHGPALFNEFRFMELAGLTPMEILASATAGGAAVFSARPDFGELVPGQHADLVVLDADPLDDLTNAARINSVIRSGRFMSPAELLCETPAETVQRQINAYNARNLDAFLEAYADDSELTLGQENAAENPAVNLIKSRLVRESYAQMFREAPKLHCQVLQRKVDGTTIIDRQRVTGLKDDKVIERTATYEVRNGKIQSVHVVQDP